ncbi:MAG: FecR domain-containing protein [Sulfuricurvum sp.]|uniref:FecR family protein n=1 Tax=Sulfuricurvum sp. TaxID=2025608 RepID=UPI00260D1575|nr:FecR domain-containing protein [uncultured Sulfuricurvum sp.]MDD2837536.1 FecR domain-containing protein [Sulfuricurvum sp.]MDD4884516.1 FecR domain-containing protein [Sulfuricurvum sp.]
MILKSIVILMMMTLSVFASEAVAFIKNVRGETVVKRENAILPAEKGEQLLRRDVIQTGATGTLGVSFNDGTRVSVGPKSVLVIDDYLFQPSEKVFRFDLTLQKGTAVFESGKIGKLAPEKVNFRVPQGVIGIRGTKFVVEAE